MYRQHESQKHIYHTIDNNVMSVKDRLKFNYSSTLDPNRGIKIGTSKRNDFTLNP